MIKSNGGALEKMTIVAMDYDDKAKTNEQIGRFVAMYNPNTFTVAYSVGYDKAEQMGKGKAAQKFLKRVPRTLTVELFFDGTGASPSSNHPGALAADSVTLQYNAPVQNQALPVNDQVDGFKKAVYDIDREKHKNHYVVFVWGTFIFAGVVESFNIVYSLFASDGTPLRAKINITAKEHIGADQLNFELNLHSPDLTRSRTVIAGDTLYNLAQAVYRESGLYLELARVNNLKNYRKLVPGTQLLFPPIEKLKNRS